MNNLERHYPGRIAEELHGGKVDSYPTTPTTHANHDNKVDKETKEVLSAITEPTMDSNGQYSLF